MKRFTERLHPSLNEETEMTTAPTSTRVCFTLRVRPEMLDEYLRRHSPVRAEMLAEIAAAGRRNYSLFLGDAGLLVGYYETDDDAAAQAYLAASEVATRWEAEMAPFFIGLDGRPDQAATPLAEVFHLDDQIADAASATRTSRGDAASTRKGSEDA